MSVNSSATINTEDIYDYVDVIFQKKYILTAVIIIIVIYILSTLIKPSYSNRYLEKKPDNSGWFISFLLFLFIVFLSELLGLLRLWVRARVRVMVWVRVRVKGQGKGSG